MPLRPRAFTAYEAGFRAVALRRKAEEVVDSATYP